jgi:hypothetical protein
VSPYRKPGRKLTVEDLPPKPSCYCDCSAEQQHAFRIIFVGPHTKACWEWRRQARMMGIKLEDLP